MRPIMLALSTFRESDKAIQLAIEESRKTGRLVVVFVADVNLARYFIGTDVGMFPELRESYEEEVLKEHRARGEEIARVIEEKAVEHGIMVRTRVEIGRFGLVCLDVARAENPQLIITTRSKRPKWVKRFFGSPVDDLIAHAGCPVVEA